MTPPWLKTITDDRLALMAPARRGEVLLQLAWLLHAEKISAPITAGGVTFDPGKDFQTTLGWLGHSYAAAKNGVVTDFVWVHDDGSTQALTDAQLIAVYEAGAARTEAAFKTVGQTILPGIAGGTITTKAQIDALF